MQTNEDLTFELIRKATFGSHTEFQFIRNRKEYFDNLRTRRAYLLLVSSIKKSSGKLFKSYCKDVVTSSDDVNKLLAYCTVSEVLRFYEEELDIISDMICEYEAYLMDTDNFLYAYLFNEQRPLSKLWDHRG